MIEARGRAAAFRAFLDAHPGAFAANGQTNVLNGQDGDDLFHASAGDTGDWLEGEMVIPL